MGGYLSIVNNTQSDWYCKIGPDEKALSVSKYVSIAVGATALVISTAGAAAPVVAAMAANGVISVVGVSTGALAAITGAAAAAGGVASVAGTASLFSTSVAIGIESSLKDDGFVHIRPREKHTWGKMSLSLWQQGTCVSTVILDPAHVQTKTLYMRPIFSASTAGENRDHDIQYWLNKHGTKNSTIEAVTSSQRSQ